MTDFSVLRQRMVDNQIRTSEVTDRDVIDAFLSVPRETFAAPDERAFAYADRELQMAAGAAPRRMMDPVRLARLVHALPRGSDIKAMVIGCGSGYSAAVLSQLVGSVVAVEEEKALASVARDNLAAVGVQNVTLVEGKLTEGHPLGCPYNAVLIDGAVEIVPEALLLQLAPGGAMAAIERDAGVSRAMLYERVGKDTTKWPLFDAWAALLPGFERRREFVF
jgi:protein-L-isoaspartate(D-aspartate) O-methyltransferase